MTGIPVFRYHPDPVATGSAQSSDAPCDICGAQSGYRYAGQSSANKPTTCVWTASLVVLRQGHSPDLMVRPSSPTSGGACRTRFPP
ncbi:MAG TPA: CbrC family protein [Actinomycetes bacterium]